MKCFNCGEPGHVSRECPARGRPWEPVRRDPGVQAEINEKGVALCRAAIRRDTYGPAVTSDTPS